MPFLDPFNSKTRWRKARMAERVKRVNPHAQWVQAEKAGAEARALGILYSAEKYSAYRK